MIDQKEEGSPQVREGVRHLPVVSTKEKGDVIEGVNHTTLGVEIKGIPCKCIPQSNTNQKDGERKTGKLIMLPGRLATSPQIEEVMHRLKVGGRPK